MMNDEMLRLAAAEADHTLCDSLLATMEKEHTFSARFERRMNHLIHRTKHPVFYPVLRQAACFLLLLVLAGTTWLTVDVQARAAFFAWVRQQYESFTEYRFVSSAPDTLDLDLYEPAWLPEGFEKQKQTITDTTSMIVYTDSNDRMISLLYSQGADAVSLFVIPEDATVQTVSVNGQPADFYLESDPESANGLVWASETGDILFCLTAPLPEDILIQIAESISVSPH